MPDLAPKIEVKKSSLAPSSIVFFGGNYLGSKLVEKLLEKESRVIVVDKFDSQKENYYINLRNNPKLLIVNCEVEKGIPSEISSCDYVYFLNHQDYYNPVDKFKIVETTQFTKNIINFSLKSQAKVVFVSNVEIKNDFFKKTVDTQKLIEEIVSESEESKNLNFRQVKLPIIYGPRMSLENSGGLIKILDNYLNKDNISLDDDNNHKNYFLFVDDAVEAIIRTIFSEKTQQQVISVVGGENFSELEIGSIMKSISPRSLEIKYIEDNKYLKWDIPEEKNLFLISFAPKVTLRNGLVKTLSYFGHETNTYSFKPEKVAQDNNESALNNLRRSIEDVRTKEPEKKPKISYERYKSTKRVSTWIPKTKKDFLYSFLTLTLTFALIFIILPLGTLYYNLTTIKNSFQGIQQSINSGNLDEGRTQATDLTEKIDGTYNNLQKFKFIITTIQSEKSFNDYSNTLLSIKYLSQGLSEFTEGVKPFLSFSKSLKDGKEIDPIEFNSSVTPLNNSLQNFIKAQSLIEDVEIKNPEFEDYKTKLPKLVKVNEILLASSRDAKELLGFNEPKKILILFQNQAEIRPTGGFIGSYGVVELSKGKILSIKIDDIYNPDGQIDVKRISIAPPEIIRYFLKENKQYIRNANFNSDFPSSAKIINDLFSKTTGENFQTVIAIDASFISKFLEKFGGIYLNTYQEEINAGNFTERAQFHSEVNYQPGVSEKKSFLTTLGSKVLEKFFSLKESEISIFADSIYELLENKDIQIYTEMPFLSRSLENLEWDGALIPTKGDYLKIVNSNFGGNKVNYVTQNNYKYSITSMTRDGILRGTVVLEYKNNAKNNAWPYGNFVNYVKVLTPVGAKLTNAKIVNPDGKEVSILNNVIMGSESIYQSFETSITIEPTTTKTLIIEYDLPESLGIVKNKNTKYSLLWQKQSGEENSFSFEFTPLNGFKGEDPISNKLVGQSEGTFISSGSLSTNFKFSIGLK